jgi:deoxyribodipyrimidine photo-lyase
VRTLLWFRGKDLRLADHEPLRATKNDELIPLFVLDPYFFAPARASKLPHRIQFLLASLEELARSLEALGSKLLVVEGRSVDVVPSLARALSADRVVAHRWSEPFGIERDRRIAAKVRLDLFEGETLASPGAVLTGARGPFAVFSAYARAFEKNIDVGTPRRPPRALPPPPRHRVRSVRIPKPADLGLTPNPNLVPGGERAARARLATFLATKAGRYHEARDLLAEDGTSRLSQDLKFGTLSVRTVWNAARVALEDEAPRAWRSFANELLWREFAYDVLRHRPSVLEVPFRPAWKRFPWRKDARALAAWKEGRTGYPVVDAAQRQLLAEGFIPNRARMISASFFAKHLMLDFRLGEAHFMKYLTDGDWANNDLGWQWSTGCGVDAQPYFRMFNPVRQGEKFDPDGAWVKRFVPELERVPVKYIHHPWDAPSRPRTYPSPIVDHHLARGRFLAASSVL